MSTAVTDAPFMPQPTLNQLNQKEKLVLPTINTSRKLQIVDVLSFANLAAANNNSNLMNMGQKTENEGAFPGQSGVDQSHQVYNSASVMGNPLYQQHAKQHSSVSAANFNTTFNQTFNNDKTQKGQNPMQNLNTLSNFYRSGKDQ